MALKGLPAGEAGSNLNNHGCQPARVRQAHGNVCVSKPSALVRFSGSVPANR
jgi:hypothetical protein